MSEDLTLHFAQHVADLHDKDVVVDGDTQTLNVMFLGVCVYSIPLHAGLLVAA